MTAPVRFPRFFVTSSAPCPYLPGREERKVFTELKGDNSEALNEALGRIGFRRSQTVAYRPSCAGCNACVSVRIAANDFVPSNTQKRNIRRNRALVAVETRPWATEEQFALLQKYLSQRHPGGGMTNMDQMDYADMVEHTPVNSYVIEYREMEEDGSPGPLVGACLTDQQADGLSMIYSFYDPDNAKFSGLGNYIILDHISRAVSKGLNYVYLGYWVKGSDRMRYKVRFRPLEYLTQEGWRRFSKEEQDQLIAQTNTTPRAQTLEGDSPSKYGPADQYKMVE